MDDLNAFTGLVRRCVDDYGMIEAGDAIAVRISGGKDSLMTLAALRCLQGYYPKPFTLHAVTCHMGFDGMDMAPVAAWCEALGVPYTVVPTEIRQIVFDLRQESNPCSLCAKLRKGALNNAALSLGCSKVALGHHFDDAVETFVMNLLLEGRLGCFRPVTRLDRSGVTQIRPLLYAGEQRVANLAKRMGLPIVQNTCPMDGASKRQECKTILAQLSQRFPDLKTKIFGAMQRLPLPGWGKER